MIINKATKKTRSKTVYKGGGKEGGGAVSSLVSKMSLRTSNTPFDPGGFVIIINTQSNTPSYH